ncbi:MAG TPA: galactosyltransferase-related protein [Polyangiaceae bacterium]|nr:galactosyltransferase-related protein [Polyangiaceae bacterium]
MLSIVVSWRDRVELGRALPSLLDAAASVGGDVTVINYAGDRRLLRDQLGPHAGAVRVVEVAGEAYFNKSAAQNVGAAHTAHPVLFFCDCDIVLEPGTVRELVGDVLAAEGRFATLAGVRESEVNSRGGNHVVSFGYVLRIRTADGRRLEIVDNEEDAHDGTRQAPGLLLVRREDFLAVNGYNSGLHGWGWEDQDMISRLTLGRGLTRLSKGNAVHLSHDDRARIAHYPVTDRWESRDRMFRKALSNYDRADFRGTYDRDVARLDARLDAPAGEPGR